MGPNGTEERADLLCPSPYVTVSVKASTTTAVALHPSVDRHCVKRYRPGVSDISSFLYSLKRCISEMHSKREQMFVGVGWMEGGSGVVGVLLPSPLFQHLRTRALPIPLLRRKERFEAATILASSLACSLVGYTENEALPEENSREEGERANFRNGQRRRNKGRSPAPT